MTEFHEKFANAKTAARRKMVLIAETGQFVERFLPELDGRVVSIFGENSYCNTRGEAKQQAFRFLEKCKELAQKCTRDDPR